MPVRLSLFLPTFATDLARRRSRLDPGCPIVLTVADQQREIVGACCQLAARAGVVEGMALADARALLSSHRPHITSLDAASVRRALDRLAVKLLMATPVVALDGTGGLWLDASGCERVYRGIDRLIRRLRVWFAGVEIGLRVAAGPTWGAAWALARFGPQDTEIVSAGDVRARLGVLPIAALRVDAELIQRLALVGIVRIQHLLDVPRVLIAERYGGLLLRRLDQALGKADESITPIRPLEPIIAERMFDGPTGRIEDIERCTQMLIGRVSAALARREQGCRRLDVTLYRSDLPPLSRTASVSRLTRDAKDLWHLIRPKIENAQLGFGVIGVRARACDAGRMPHEQAQAWAREEHGDSVQAVAQLIDVLISRLPHDQVCRIAAVESHVPERSFTYEPIDRIDGDAMNGRTITVDDDRPSLLLPEPMPVDVTLLLPDGPLAAIRGREITRRIIASVGPERIEPEWWRDDGAARDYFKVQTEDGRWLWMYRTVTAGRWYVHGEWA